MTQFRTRGTGRSRRIYPLKNKKKVVALLRSGEPNISDKYDHYTRTGYTKDQAINKITKEEQMTDYAYVKRMYAHYQKQTDREHGAKAISMHNVKRSKELNDWIKEKESQGKLVDKGDKLEFK